MSLLSFLRARCHTKGSRSSVTAQSRHFRCCLETLETRQLLSVNVPRADVDVAPESDSGVAVVLESATNEVSHFTVVAVHLRVDGEAFVITSSEETVTIREGALLEVVGVEYELDGTKIVDD